MLRSRSAKMNWWRFKMSDSDSSHHHAEHRHSHGHGHTHGVIDASISTSDRGIWAIKWSFIGLFVTALIQIVVAYLSKSIGLLADTIHNFGDAATAIPLWVAFALARWKPNKRFTYGYGRVEDLAGVAIVLTIAFSALVAGYETIRRFIHPQPVGYLWAVMAASETKLSPFSASRSAKKFRAPRSWPMGITPGLTAGRVSPFSSAQLAFGSVIRWPIRSSVCSSRLQSYRSFGSRSKPSSHACSMALSQM